MLPLRDAARVSAYRRGQRFRVTDTRQVPILIHWGAPLTTGVTASLPVGTVLVISHDPLPTGRGFYTQPEEYESLERTVIPDGDLHAESYDGYSIVVGDDEVGDWLELIE
jgi:hypothetical protein